MKIYLAASYGAGYMMQQLAKDLERDGHTITSDWHAPKNWRIDLEDKLTVAQQVRAANENQEQILEADAVIFSPNPPGYYHRGERGTRWAEFGFALAHNKKIFIIAEQQPGCSPWFCLEGVNGISPNERGAIAWAKEAHINDA